MSEKGTKVATKRGLMHTCQGPTRVQCHTSSLLVRMPLTLLFCLLGGGTNGTATSSSIHSGRRHVCRWFEAYHLCDTRILTKQPRSTFLEKLKFRAERERALDLVHGDLSGPVHQQVPTANVSSLSTTTTASVASVIGGKKSEAPMAIKRF